MSENASSCACGAKPASACESSSAGKPTGIQNGKGDAPRNISERFRSNYEGINWGTPKKSKR
jgi:hypothetical protein